MFDYEKEHIHALRNYLPECTVLLKQDGSFPIDAPCKVALYGSGARHTIKGGTGSGDVNSRYFVTVEKGLKNAGFTVTTNKWLDAYDNLLAKTRKEFIKEIKKRAKKNHKSAEMESLGAIMTIPDYEFPLDGEGELALYVLSRNSGEGSDREYKKGDILLTDTEIRDILFLNQHYEKFMLVLNVGGPVELTALKAVKNILLLSQLGVETGNVLAAIVLGKMNPSGKLATSWVSEKDTCKIGEFGEKDETRYREGIYVGYRYYDTVGIKNDFPFGFGLSYTDFSIVCRNVEYRDGKVGVTVRVRNTGRRAGKEVVQLYVSVPSGKLDQPYQTLAAFEKTRVLKESETQDLFLCFVMADLAGYDEENSRYLLEQGEYILRLGNSSINTSVCGVLKLDKDRETLKVRKCCGTPDFKDWIPEKVRRETVPDEVISLAVRAETIPQGEVIYDETEEIDPFVDTLSDEQLTYAAMGHFNPKAGNRRMVGSASLRRAGAAGETTDKLERMGFPALVLADGPAGIRLAKRFAATKKREYIVGDPLPAGMSDFLSFRKSLMIKIRGKKIPPSAVHGERYATAIPIGTAVAQSFNSEFAKLCGDIVGAEMEIFGVHLWLAPALNIHRSIRCGRNFEYYSEDPLVSGTMAAALTEGVQKHPGCAVTIKHYAVNNQETCRTTNNSQVSERALREIYLKGYGICIQKGKPHAVMTSYNLLNGIHTAERRDLVQDILRCEYGFKGIVMTDWVVAGMKDADSKYDITHSAPTAVAGGDLFMPGRKEDYDELLSAIRCGKVTRKQMKINVTRIYRLANQLSNTSHFE